MNKRWTTERAQAWSNAHAWACGFNYLPSSAVNSTEMWQRETFDAETIARELDWARAIGFNSCRVFLPFLVWETDEKGFLQRLDTFLELASSRGLSTMPTLFDDCAFAGREPYLGPQEEPIAGVHNSGWTPSPGFALADTPTAWPRLQAYVHAIVGRFQADARVLLWDVYNEPANSDRGDKSLPLLQAAFTWAREVAPEQPLTAAPWYRRPWQVNDFMLAESDVLSFHDYGSASQTQAWIDELRVQKRPIFCTEWMSRTLESRFDTHLPLFREANVGCFFWGLVNGRTQTHFPWSSPQGATPPDLWFHDLLSPDGTPCNAREVELLQQMLKS